MENFNLKEIEMGNKKIPKFVSVYNKLFEMISKGKYKSEIKLPSEPELAKEMGVSRMTLRQALSLLQDDGIIKNIRGKGNYIIKTDVKKERGLEFFENPIYNILKSDVDDIEIEFRIEPSGEYSTKTLEKKATAVVFVDRWYKKEGRCVAYTLSLIPIEEVVKEKLNLTNKDDILNFLEKEIYEKSEDSKIKISFSDAGSFSSMKYSLGEIKKCYLLEEVLKIKKEIVVHNKHYISIEEGNVTINRKKL